MSGWRSFLATPAACFRAPKLPCYIDGFEYSNTYCYFTAARPSLNSMFSSLLFGLAPKDTAMIAIPTLVTFLVSAFAADDSEL